MSLKDTLTNLQKIHDSLDRLPNKLKSDRELSLASHWSHERKNKEYATSQQYVRAFKLWHSGTRLEDIAAIMDKSVGTVRGYLHRLMWYRDKEYVVGQLSSEELKTLITKARDYENHVWTRWSNREAMTKPPALPS